MTIDEIYDLYREHPDTDTLTELFTACRLYALAICREYRRHDAEDAAAEAVAKAWVSLASFQPMPDSSFRAWFRVIVRNTVFDISREPANRYGASAMDWERLELAGQNHAEALRAVDAIEGLTDEQRLTLKIFNITENFEATARHLGISQNTLTARLKRIREKSLRKAS